MKKYNYIYKTTCKISNTFYIGMHSTDNLDDAYLGSGLKLTRSILKYGKEAHTKEILFFESNREMLRKREREIVNEGMLADPLCLNLALGGSGPPECTDDYRNKISKANLGKKRTEEHRRKYSIAAINRIKRQKDSGTWEQTKIKIAKSASSKKQTQESIDKRIETIKQLRLEGKIKRFSEQARKNISNSLIGSSRNKKTWELADNYGQRFLVQNLEAWLRLNGFRRYGFKKDKICDSNNTITHFIVRKLNE